ncbi:hypothetical protein GCM10010985_07480 [Caballeronia grimmiae]|uniref:Uncharacterized protein n=1 Tax=Caballeronia grimmiae TaxID=1071679 RepID=A0ABQ1R4Y5_9BURK|nr:hypothetical protein GCM10010985_07480 [Caballeronia grimmiae]
MNITEAVAPLALRRVENPLSSADAVRIESPNGEDTSAPLKVMVPPCMVTALAEMARQAAAPAIAKRPAFLACSVDLPIAFPGSLSWPPGSRDASYPANQHVRK